jgi:hypothetical protein
MDSLAGAWHRLIENRRLGVAASAAVIAAGVLIIATGEVLEWGWTRIIGAGAISLAAVALGGLLGWSDPIRPRLAGIIVSWSTILVAILAAIIVLPLLFGFITIFGGLILGAASITWYLVLAGIAVVLVFSALAVLAAFLGISSAFEGLRTTHPDQDYLSSGGDE